MKFEAPACVAECLDWEHFLHRIVPSSRWLQDHARVLAMGQKLSVKHQNCDLVSVAGDKTDLITIQQASLTGINSKSGGGGGGSYSDLQQCKLFYIHPQNLIDHFIFLDLQKMIIVHQFMHSNSLSIGFLELKTVSLSLLKCLIICGKLHLFTTLTDMATRSFK